jgi:hypothetical protein
LLRLRERLFLAVSLHVALQPASDAQLHSTNLPVEISLPVNVLVELEHTDCHARSHCARSPQGVSSASDRVINAGSSGGNEVSESGIAGDAGPSGGSGRCEESRPGGLIEVASAEK